MEAYLNKPPFSDVWSSERSERFKRKRFGTINIGSRLRTENPVSLEIDRILSERLSVTAKKTVKTDF